MARQELTWAPQSYFIVQGLTQCKDVDGDVCEFGVAQGDTSAVIANELTLLGDKTLHLFDSFQGLPAPSKEDHLKDDVFSLGDMESYAGTLSCVDDMVRARLKEISFPPQRYAIHKGFVEEVLREDENLPRQVSFAYVDLDLYEPTRIVLDFLHRVTPSGAKIIVDEYDFFTTGPKQAVDEFIEEKNATDTLYECSIPDERYGHFAVLTRIGRSA